MLRQALSIINARPPNYAKIAAVFDLARWPGAIFCYGDTIYNPGCGALSPALLAHEAAHSERQKPYVDPELWWDRYLADRAFRLEEEIVAHQAEWRHFCAQGWNRQQRRRYLAVIAGRLASPLYGSMITVQGAKEIIEAEAA